MEKNKILLDAVDAISGICDKIIKKENYKENMPACVKAIQDACVTILHQDSTDADIIPLLEDFMYGMTQNDEVFLLDVLRFGIMTKLESML